MSDEIKPGLTPHQRIVRAARRRTGVRLSAYEVAVLAMDDAIATCAEWDDMDTGTRERIHQEDREYERVRTGR